MDAIEAALRDELGFEVPAFVRTEPELEAIAASFIGGASMSGGVGTVLGAVIGGLVLGVLDNGMQLVGVGEDWQQVIKGLVLLVAVAFDIWNKRRGLSGRG